MKNKSNKSQAGKGDKSRKVNQKKWDENWQLINWRSKIKKGEQNE